MNDIQSLRFGQHAALFALVCCLIAVVSIPFLTSNLLAFRCIGMPYINGRLELANFIWTCPDLLRLALISMLSALVIFSATGVGHWAASRELRKPFRGSFSIRMMCIVVTVGATNLAGIYASEYWGGQGKLSPIYIVGVPLLVSMLHYPRWLGLVLAIPAMVLGFFGLVFIAVLTGLPLD